MGFELVVGEGANVVIDLAKCLPTHPDLSIREVAKRQDQPIREAKGR